MNRPIVRIYVLVLLLLATLVYFTSKWAVFDAEELEANRDNRRPLIEEQQIPRGSITTADGVLVAESLPEGGGRNPVYVRRYPQGSLFGNPVGYSYVEVERTGIELSENDLLIGEENEFATIIDQLRDQQPEGANITLTLDSEAQRIATEGLQSAISVPGTGRHWWRSSPPRARCARWPRSGFDPNEVQNPELQGPDRRRVGAAAQPPDAEHVSAGVDDEGRHRGGLDSGSSSPRPCSTPTRRRRSAAWSCRTPAGRASATST